MTVTLHCGDCLEVLPTLETQSVDAICTDLPYGTTACKWDTVIPFAPMWEQVKRILKPRGVFVTTASQPFTSLLIMSNLEWFRYELIWGKKQGSSPGIAKFRPMPSHENIVIFRQQGRGTYNPQMREGFKPWKRVESGKKLKNEHGYGYSNEPGFIKRGGESRYPLSVIKVDYQNGCGQQLHPTQKPVALYEYLIRTYTNEGDTVLDICAGSGTTGIAAIKTRRNAILIERDPEYFKIMQKRINDALAQPALDLKGV